MSDDVHFNFTHAQRPRVAKSVVRPITDWTPADDSGRFEKNTAQPLVEARICEFEEQDDYGGVLTMRPIIEHRFFDQVKIKIDPDIATTNIAPENMLDQVSQDNVIIRKGLKTRFKTHLDAYERFLRANGRDLPLDMLGDLMYPDLILTLRAFGIRTAQAFAVLHPDIIAKVKAKLEKDNNGMVAERVEFFQKRTADRLRESGFAVPQPEPEQTPTPKKSTSKAA